MSRSKDAMIRDVEKLRVELRKGDVFTGARLRTVRVDAQDSWFIADLASMNVESQDKHRGYPMLMNMSTHCGTYCPTAGSNVGKWS